MLNLLTVVYTISPTLLQLPLRRPCHTKPLIVCVFIAGSGSVVHSTIFVVSVLLWCSDYKQYCYIATNSMIKHVWSAKLYTNNTWSFDNCDGSHCTCTQSQFVWFRELRISIRQSCTGYNKLMQCVHQLELDHTHPKTMHGNLHLHARGMYSRYTMCLSVG